MSVKLKKLAGQNRYCIFIIFFYSSLHLHPLLRFKLQPIHGTQILSRGVCVSLCCSRGVLMVRAMREVKRWVKNRLRRTAWVCFTKLYLLAIS